MVSRPGADAVFPFRGLSDLIKRIFQLSFHTKPAEFTATRDFSETAWLTKNYMNTIRNYSLYYMKQANNRFHSQSRIRIRLHKRHHLSSPKMYK